MDRLEWPLPGSQRTIDATDPETAEGRDYRIVEVLLDRADVEQYYDGFSNSALWPLYHDAIAAPTYHRHQFDAYRRVNMLFAQAAAPAAPGATVWIHDYQLQLVPAMLRSLRPDLRIGFFLHIPFPAPTSSCSCRGGDQSSWESSALTLWDSKPPAVPATSGRDRTFARVASQRRRRRSPRSTRRPPRSAWGAFAVSVDVERLDEIARRPETAERAAQLRRDLGNPKTMLLGVDRLDYTKGIDVRLRAYTELLQEKRLGPNETVLVQVATQAVRTSTSTSESATTWS